MSESDTGQGRKNMNKKDDALHSVEYADLKSQCDMQDKTILKLVKDMRALEEDMIRLEKKLCIAISYKTRHVIVFPDDRRLTWVCIWSLLISIAALTLQIFF